MLARKKDGALLQRDSDADTSEDEDELMAMPITGSMDDMQYDSLHHESRKLCSKFILDHFYEPRHPVGHKHMHELSFLLDFLEEHRRMTPVNENSYFTPQRARLFCLVLISLPYLTAVLFWDFHNFFVPFTNWTLIMTTLSLLLTINAARDTAHYHESALKRRKALNAPCKYRTVALLQALHHVIYTLSIVMNMIVMSVYWTILHSGQMAEYSAADQWGKRLHERTVHSLPGTVCLINLLVSRIRLKQGFWKVIVVVVIIYSLFLHHEYVKYGII